MHNDAFLDDLLAQMTLAEKVGQMTQAEKNSISPADVTTYGLGSVLSGGGGNPTPNDPPHWRAMVQAYLEAAQATRLRIPLIYGVDAVHGHNNMYGATVFPHNIGLGAARDPELVERIGAATAREMLASHVHWNFAPCLAVAQDPRWGRTYESYGPDPSLVGELGAAYVRGLQSQGVAACAKHYVGDGGAEWGTHRRVSWVQFWEQSGGAWTIDQGDVNISEEELRRVHLAPYLPALAAGALTVMASFSSWRGLKMHAHRYLLTDVLKGELGFQGFIVSDWMGINQLSPDLYTCVIWGINAGLDMIMVPYDYKAFISTLIKAVEAGDVPMARIDDAVRRILWVKQRLGLFEQPTTSAERLNDVRTPQHQALAREAVAKSLVLLKDEAQALPLRHPHALKLAGLAADDIGLQCGGWTIEWMGKPGRDVVPGETLRAALEAALPDTAIDYSAEGHFSQAERAPVGLVVVAEHPYAEGGGDSTHPTLSTDDLTLIARTRAACNKLILLIFSGRPLHIPVQAEALCDAIVAAWLPGSAGAGLADVLTGAQPFSGHTLYPLARWTQAIQAG
jgi:beta-glucosidase